MREGLQVCSFYPRKLRAQRSQVICPALHSWDPSGCLEPLLSSSLPTYPPIQGHSTPSHLAPIVQSGWSPTAHLTSLVNPNVTAQAFSVPFCLFAIQVLAIGQGQVQVLLCPQSHYLLLLGVLIILSLYSTLFTSMYDITILHFWGLFFHLFFISQFLSNSIMHFFPSLFLPKYNTGCH